MPMAETGVRFIQVFHRFAMAGAPGAWDAPSATPRRPWCPAVARPINPSAVCAKTSKSRWYAGRNLYRVEHRVRAASGAQGGTGCDSPSLRFLGFGWRAGGTKRGIAYRASDELGFHAVENRHYVTDLHRHRPRYHQSVSTCGFAGHPPVANDWKLIMGDRFARSLRSGHYNNVKRTRCHGSGLPFLFLTWHPGIYQSNVVADGPYNIALMICR